MITSTSTVPITLQGVPPETQVPLQQDAGVRGNIFGYAPLDQRRLWKHLEYSTEIPVLRSHNRTMVDLTPFYPYPSYWMSTLPEYQTFPNRQIGFDGHGRPMSKSMPYYKEYMPGLEAFECECERGKWRYSVQHIMVMLIVVIVVLYYRYMTK